ncbi:hypothetical protein Ga0100231_007970 [Opitutaceae bacterium TAV4]|nr:hypothetical protein Ga0100231_007970 [Opitutaceae bacterium TAV4]RRJ98395.1 hypothetical protein Ga0100230_008240 [Opitutaceae bacterium TAV3]
MKIVMKTASVTTVPFLRFVLPSFALAILAPLSVQADTWTETFNAYVNGADFPPSSFPAGSPNWTAWQAGTGSGGLSRLTTSAAESPFTAVEGGLGFLFEDSTTQRSGGIQTSFSSGFTTPFVISFDYKILPGGDTTPQLRLSDPTSVATNPGIFLQLGALVDGKYYIRNVASTSISLYEIQLDTWYRVSLTVDPAISRYSATITPYGEASVTVTDLAFRGASANITLLGFTNSGVTSQKGSWALDNISVIPEPSTYGIAIGAIFLASAILRRPWEK